MHYAAMHNRPQLIAVLIQQGMDINARKVKQYMPGGKCVNQKTENKQ